jgi:VIT1/CCC1 family predicted Fe2+/Mn2+ transporter
MLRATFSLRHFLGLVLVCCMVLASYRVGLQQGRHEVIQNATTEERRLFDQRIGEWAATEEKWLLVRKIMANERRPFTSFAGIKPDQWIAYEAWKASQARLAAE